MPDDNLLAGISDPTQSELLPFLSRGVATVPDISTPLETGSRDPMIGLRNISRDTNGSLSYGNYGLNSLPGASAWQFRREYGPDLGITADPGTSAFNMQWAQAANTYPEKLRAAEQNWYQKNVIDPVSSKLRTIGIPDNVATDPRVQAYFSDRVVQQGPGSITMPKHALRISSAYNSSGGDPVAFLRAQSTSDLQPSALQSDFPAALSSGVYSPSGNYHRVTGRLSGALGVNAIPDNALPMEEGDRTTQALLGNQPPAPVARSMVANASAQALPQSGQYPQAMGGQYPPPQSDPYRDRARALAAIAILGALQQQNQPRRLPNGVVDFSGTSPNNIGNMLALMMQGRHTQNMIDLLQNQQPQV